MLHKIKGTSVCPPRPDLMQILTGLVGGILGISAITWLTQLAEVPLLMAPFGATCVLLFAAPNAPLAQPRNVIGGHCIAALVGIVIFQLAGSGPLAMAIAVGVAIALMQVCRAVHPPAGANPLVIMLADIHEYHFLLTPVLAGSVILVLVALVINNVGAGKRWPNYWF